MLFRSRAEAEGQPPAPPTGGAPAVDYNIPAYMRRPGTQTDMFQGELDKTRGFSLDDTARATPENKGASYAESVEAAKLKLKEKGTSALTRDEINLLRSEPDSEIGSYDEGRQMSLLEDTGEKRAKRQAEIESAFRSVEPDLLGDVLPQRAEPTPEVTPTTQEQLADTRQGALQFAPAAPETPRPLNTQMADQLEGIRRKQQEDAAYQQRQAEETARREAETRRAENERQLQIADEARRAEEQPPTPAARMPVQESFPGMGVRYGDKVRANQEAARAEAAQETPEAVSGVVTQDMLTGFGVLPAAPVRKRIVGKDLSDPTQRAQVQRELSAYARNDAVPPESREKVSQFLQSPVFMEQTPMFGPKGGATAAAVEKKEAPRAELKPIEPVTPITGKGVSVPSRPATDETAQGTGAPRDGGVDVSASSTGQTGVREEPKQGALTEFKLQPLEPIAPLATTKPLEKYENLHGASRAKAIRDEIALNNKVIAKAKEKGETALVKKMEQENQQLESLLDEAEARDNKDRRTSIDRQVLKQSKSELDTAVANKEVPKAKADKLVEEARETGNVADASKRILEGVDETPSAEEQAALQAELDAELGQEPTTFEEASAQLYEAQKDAEKAKKKFDRLDNTLATDDARRKKAAADLEKADKKASRAAESAAKLAPAKKEKPAEKAAPKTESKAPKKDVPEDVGAVKVSQARAGSLFERIKSEGYGIDKEDVDSKDVNRATLLKVGKSKLTATAEAAKLYFGKVPRVIDAFRNIAFDVVYNTPRFRRGSESKAEADFFQGMNGESGKLALDWVRGNMSSDANAKLDKIVQEYERQQRMTTDEALIQLFSDAFAGKETIDETIQSYLDAQEGDLKKIKLDAVQSAGLPLHPSVVMALKEGDAQGALALLAASTDGAISQTASALIKAKINPKVVVKKNLTDENGDRVPGYYDPKTDTVYLDAELGMNAHVLFHEFGHAATSHVIENKAHPLTKQLTQLFDDVKDSLDTAYGSTSLDEFVAEAWGNEEFKGKLNSINPKGEKITAWQRFTNAIVNFFRKLMGKETKGIESAYDVADRLIQAILSPAPEGRNGPMLYAAVVNPKNPMLANWLDQGVEVAMKMGVPPQYAAKAHEFLKNSTSGIAKSILLSSLPLHALSDVAKKYLPRAVDVDRLVGEKSGDEYARIQRIEPVINEAERWAKDNKQLLDKFNRIVYDSTINEVDPSVPRETYEKIKDKETREAKLKEWDAMQGDWEKLGPGEIGRAHV